MKKFVIALSLILCVSGCVFSQNLFDWQKEDYCFSEDETVNFKTRCGFEVVTDFEDGDPSNPEWYVRQTDKMDIANGQLSSLNVSMYQHHGKEFPATKEEAETYWEEWLKYMTPDNRAVIKDLMVDKRKAWKITAHAKDDNIKFSGAMEQLIIEDDENSIYTINIMTSSDSWKKVQAYLKESEQLIKSISWN